MEKTIFFICLSICLIELGVIFALLNKKKQQFLKVEESNERKGERVMSDSCNITNPFQSLENVLAFSCRDWSANPEDAWIYGIIMGWGFDEDDKGKSCTDELERKFGSNKWTKSDSKRLKVLHNNWKKAKELMAKYVKEKV